MIHNKPFNWSDKIKRALFLGRPNYFNNVDLNRYFDVLRNYESMMSRLVGFKASTSLKVKSYTRTQGINGATHKVTFDFQGGQIFAEGVRFSVGNTIGGEFSTTQALSLSGKAPMPPVFYWVLTAKTVLETFNTNPVMSGIKSDEYPTLVPSSDHEVFKDEAVTVTIDPNSVADFICILATYYPFLKSDGAIEYRTLQNVRNPAKDISFPGNEFFEAGVVKTNFSILEELAYVREDIEKAIVKLASDIDESVKLKQDRVPNRGGMMYFGNPVGHFDEMGLGINDCKGWALCLGNTFLRENGTNWVTTDLRGQFLVGYDPNTPAVPLIESGLVRNYGSVGNRGGKDEVTLLIAQMPKHNHVTGTYNRALRVSGAGTTTGTNAGGKVQVDNSGGVLNDAGDNAPHENRPYYFVTAFMERIPDDIAVEEAPTSVETIGYAEGLSEGANGNASSPKTIQETGYSAEDQALYVAAYNDGYAVGIAQFNGGGTVNYYQTGYDEGFQAGLGTSGNSTPPDKGYTEANQELYNLGYNDGYFAAQQGAGSGTGGGESGGGEGGDTGGGGVVTDPVTQN